MKKYLTIIAFAMVVFFSFSVSIEAAQTFDDVPENHTNYKDINFLIERGIIEKGKKYRPGDLITREEAIVMIAKAIDLDGTPRETKFDDVPKSNMNSGYIQSAVDEGIVNGMDEYNFKPSFNLNRLQMSLMLVRAFKLPVNYEIEEGKRLFKDVSSSTFGAGIIQSVVNAKIATGYADGSFKPYHGVTRAHMAVFLTRALQNDENNI